MATKVRTFWNVIWRWGALLLQSGALLPPPFSPSANSAITDGNLRGEHAH